MADIKYLSNIDLNGNKLKNPVIDTQTSDPSTPNVGQAYYNTSQDKLRIYDGSAWQQVGATYSFSSSNGVLTLNEDGVAKTPTFTITGGSGITLGHGTANTVEVTVANSDILSLLNSLESSSGSADETITIGADAGDTINFRGSVIVDGNLTVSGTTTTLNTATLDVEDLNITVGKNATTASAADGAGLTFGAWSSGTTPTFTWVNSTSKLTANKPLQATSFHGNVTGNVTGTVSSLSNHTFATSIGDGSATSYTVTHNLGTRDVIVQLYDNSTYDTVYADVKRLDTGGTNHNNIVTIDFTVAPTSNDIRVLITKIG